jgi:hypothetical protein
MKPNENITHHLENHNILEHYIKHQRWTKKGKDPSNVIKQKRKLKFQQTKDTTAKLTKPKKKKKKNYYLIHNY